MNKIPFWQHRNGSIINLNYIVFIYRDEQNVLSVRTTIPNLVISIPSDDEHSFMSYVAYMKGYESGELVPVSANTTINAT